MIFDINFRGGRLLYYIVKVQGLIESFIQRLTGDISFGFDYFVNNDAFANLLGFIYFKLVFVYVFLASDFGECLKEVIVSCLALCGFVVR